MGEDAEEEPPSRAQLHIVAPWIGTDGDLSHVQTWCEYFVNILFSNRIAMTIIIYRVLSRARVLSHSKDPRNLDGLLLVVLC